MKCPKCPGRMEIGETCPACGWKPTDLLEEALKNIEGIKSGHLPTIPDPEAAAQSAAYQGSGAGYALVTLGIITSQEWMEWTKRLYDAAGVEYQPLARFMSTSFEVTAEGPPAAILFSGKQVRKPTSLRGVYVDRRPQQTVRARFAYSEPDGYRWLTEDGRDGLITDGHTHVVIKDGKSVLATTEGKASVTHRFLNLLNPSAFGQEGWTLGRFEEGTSAGRDAWVVDATPTMPGKQPMTTAFDQATGIILSMSGREQFTGFEEVAFDPGLDDATFTWDGPVDEQPVGVGYVSPRHEGGWAASWQIHLSELAAGYDQDKAFESKEEAVAWAQERAVEVVLRED